MEGKAKIIITVLFCIGAVLYYGGSALLEIIKEKGEVPQPPEKGNPPSDGK